MSTRDHFRPTREPAQTIYDALMAEAEYRDERSVDEWVDAERRAVWKAARDYAQQHGLRIPTMDDVERAEWQGIGHVDYAAKTAHCLVRTMEKPE